MAEINKKCFVCGKRINAENSTLHKAVFLPVCFRCKGSEEEKRKTGEYLDSLGDGFVCGCI